MNIDFLKLKEAISKMNGNLAKDDILRCVADHIQQQALQKLSSSIIIEEQEEDAAESQIKIEEIQIQNNGTIQQDQPTLHQKEQAQQHISIDLQKNSEPAQNYEIANQELDKDINQEHDCLQLNIDNIFQQNSSALYADLVEEDLFQNKQTIINDINQKIADGKIKIIAKPNISYLLNDTKKNQKKADKVKKEIYQVKKKIQKRAKQQRCASSSRANKKRCKEQDNSKKKYENFIDDSQQKIALVQDKCQDKKFQEAQNKDQTIQNMQQTSAKKTQDAETQTDILPTPQSDFSEINLNIGLSNYEKAKIELLSIQMRSQINEGIYNFRAAQIDGKEGLSEELMGFSKINGQFIPFVQKSPFFIQKEKLSTKSQILFEQSLKENFNSDQLLLKSQIVLQHEDATLIQKTLHKVQQQFKKQKK